MCVPPKTWNIAREPLSVAIYLISKTSIFKGSKLPAKEAIASFGTKGSNFKGSMLVAIYLIIRHPYSKEASRPQRKQLLPLVLKEAISKEAISKEAIPKEAIPKEAIPKEAILNAPTSFHPLPPKDEDNRAHNKIP
jgi:hypothetical protein